MITAKKILLPVIISIFLLNGIYFAFAQTTKNCCGPTGPTCENLYNRDGCYTGYYRSYYCSNTVPQYSEICTSYCCGKIGGICLENNICSASPPTSTTTTTIPTTTTTTSSTTTTIPLPCTDHNQCSQACSSLCPAGVYGCCYGCELGQCVNSQCQCLDATTYCSQNPPYQVGSVCGQTTTTTSSTTTTLPPLPTTKIIDDNDPRYSDTGWNVAPPNGPAQGYDNSVHWKNRNGTGYAVWKPNFSGKYYVFVSWTIDSNRPTNAKYTVYYDGGQFNFTINQTKFPNGTVSTSSDWSGWYYVGVFNFASGNITLWDDVTDGKILIADAVKFVQSPIKVPEDFPTIQSAINAASLGDTINVGPGTFTEQINIDKPLTLTGTGYSSTTDIISPVPSTMTIYDSFGSKSPNANYSGHRGTNIPVVRIASSNVTFQGFHVSLNNQTFWDVNGSYAINYSRGVGILVDHVETVPGTPDSFTNIIIQNNKVDGLNFTDKGDAIKVLANSTALIQNNLIYGYGESAIECMGVDGPVRALYYPTCTVNNNIIYGGNSSGARDDSDFFGIGFWSGATGSADSNTIYNTPDVYSDDTACGSALNAWTPHPVSFTNNFVTSDGGSVGKGWGAQLFESPNLVFSNNIMENQEFAGAIWSNPSINIFMSTIRNCTDGFLVDCQTSGSVTMHYNSFTGISPGHYAVKVSGTGSSGTTWGNWHCNSTVTVNATYNWWGNSTGPYHPTKNSGGTGAAVTDKVNFDPWLNDSSYLTSPPKVTSVVLDPSVNNTYVKVGNISFTINFDKTMNQLTPLNVTFGQSSPYLQNVVNGNWLNPTSWKGYYLVMGTQQIIDDTDPGFTTTGSWNSYSNSCGYGGSYHYETTTNTGDKARWTPSIGVAGNYKIFVHYCVHTARPQAVPYTVYNGNYTTVLVNQTVDALVNSVPNFSPSGWKYIGTFYLPSGNSNYVELNTSSTGDTCADAIKIESSISLPGDGMYRLRVADGKDAIGNTMTANTSFTFYVDTQNPVARNAKVPNISYLQNQTLALQAYDFGSGIADVIVQVNSTNYTMQLAYNDYIVTGYLTFAPLGTYYTVIPNSSLPAGAYNYKFFATDKSGNVNDSVSGNFYVNGTKVKTGGNIAYLCRNDPVGIGDMTTKTCDFGIENQTIKWLRSQGWTVYVQRYDSWTAAQLNGADLIVCSDEYNACVPTAAVTEAHKSNRVGFVEIPTIPLAYAGYNFGYLYDQYGYTHSGETDLFVAAPDTITAGYMGNVTIYDTAGKGIGIIRDYKLKPGSIKIADVGKTYAPYESSLFKVEKSGTQGRYAWVGWFNGISFSFPPYYYYFYGWTPQDLNLQGQGLLKKTLNWAQCGNAMGC